MGAAALTSIVCNIIRGCVAAAAAERKFREKNGKFKIYGKKAYPAAHSNQCACL
jgi:hypothetical protein